MNNSLSSCNIPGNSKYIIRIWGNRFLSEIGKAEAAQHLFWEAFGGEDCQGTDIDEVDDDKGYQQLCWAHDLPLLFTAQYRPL